MATRLHLHTSIDTVLAPDKHHCKCAVRWSQRVPWTIVRVHALRNRHRTIDDVHARPVVTVRNSVAGSNLALAALGIVSFGALKLEF